MTIQNFIENYNKGITNDIIKTKYLSQSTKDSLIESIIDVLTYEVNGMLTYDTNEFELNKKIAILKAYTNLEFEKVIDDYDLLLEHNLDSVLYELIGADVPRLNTMIHKKLSDMIRERNSLESVINRNLGVVVDALTGSIEKFTTTLSSADNKKLIKSFTGSLDNLVSTIKQ